MILYALYHVPTGNYMPARMFDWTPRGFSWWEPLGLNGYGGCTTIPRLFETKHAANVARHSWARGPQAARKVTEQDGWDSPPYEVQVGSEVVKEPTVTPRNLDDLIIRTLTLVESST